MDKSFAVTLSQLRHAGGRRAVSLESFDHFFYPQQLISKLCSATATALPVDQIEKSVSALCIAHGAGLPPSRKDRKDQMPNNEPRCFIMKLAEATRVVTSGSGTVDFETVLQVLQAGRWSTVAAYAYENGTARRWLHYSNGDKYPISMDLPADVVFEMAREDFTRNWLIYYREFFNLSHQRPRFPA